MCPRPSRPPPPSNSVTLSWGSAYADDGGAQVSSYRIEVLDGQSQWVALWLRPCLPTGPITGIQKSGPESTEYQYRIYASKRCRRRLGHLRPPSAPWPSAPGVPSSTDCPFLLSQFQATAGGGQDYTFLGSRPLSTAARRYHRLLLSVPDWRRILHILEARRF